MSLFVSLTQTSRCQTDSQWHCH